MSESPTQIRWRILALILAGSAGMYVLRSNISIASETIGTELGISKVQLGLIPAAFLWGYALFQLPGGLLSNAFGGRRVLAVIMAAWTALTLLTALPLGLASGVMLLFLAALRFLMGIAQAPFYPTTLGVTERWFPRRHWGLVNGLSSTALTLGAAATGPVMAWLIVEFGWRTGFVILSPLGLLLAGLWWWYVRDEPSEHWGTNSAEVSLIGDRAARPESATDAPLWRLVLTDRNILLLAVSYFCMSYVFWMFFNWFAFYLVDGRGFSTQASGNFFGVQWIVGAVGATAGGLLCDWMAAKLGPRRGYRRLVVTGLLATALFVGAGALVDSAAFAVTLFVLAFGATQITEAGYWTAAMSVGGHNADAAGGVMNTGGVIVGGFGAVFVPWVASTLNWEAALATGAVMALLGAACWIGINADQRMKSAS